MQNEIPKKISYCLYINDIIIWKFNKLCIVSFESSYSNYKIDIPEHRKRCIMRPSGTFSKAILISYFSKSNALKF